MFLIYGIYTLGDVIIVDPIQMDLVLRVALSHWVAMIVATQSKEGLY